MGKVFISSTHEDLASFRREAGEVAQKCGMQPIDFRHWPAAAYPPLSKCLEEIDKLDPATDVVVAIVARWHGWTPSDQPDGRHASLTRLGCEHAA